MAETGRGDIEGAVIEVRGSNSATAFACVGGERSETERRQICRPGNQALRCRAGAEERAVRRKAGDGFVAIAKKAPHPLGERERRSGALGRGDEHRPSAVRDHNSRTGAGQCAAVAAETAQPFKALLAARRQRRRETKDLHGGNVRDLKLPPRTSARAFRPEYCGANRIRPQNLRAVDAP